MKKTMHILKRKDRVGGRKQRAEVKKRELEENQAQSQPQPQPKRIYLQQTSSDDKNVN